MALVSVLASVLVLLLLSMAMVSSVLGSFRTGRHLTQEARAKQAAEAGVAHALLHLKGVPLEELSEYEKTLSGTLDTGSYQVALSCEEEERGFACRAEAEGASGEALHQALALIQVTTEERVVLKEGWFTGGTVRVNGDVQLMATRLHGDGGYTLNTGQVRICDAFGENCKTPGEDPDLAKRAVTASVYATTCNAGDVLCPPQKVCPVWGSPNPQDTTPCYDSLAGRMATVATSTRIPAVDFPEVYRQVTGLRATDDPFQALAPASCDTTVRDLTSLASALTSGTVCYEGNLNLPDGTTLAVPPGVKLVVKGDLTTDRNVSLAILGGLYVRGSYNKNSDRGSLEVRGGELVVGGYLNVKPPFTVADGRVLVGGLNLNNGRGEVSLTGAVVASRGPANFNEPFTATDSKIMVAGGGLTFNGATAPTLVGATTLGASGSVTFNGNLQSNLQGSPLLISGGDVTFNGRYANAESASFIWALGKVTMNGNTEYRGGIASGGGVDTAHNSDGIVVNGGLTLYRSNLSNDLLPTVTVTKVAVTARR